MIRLFGHYVSKAFLWLGLLEFLVSFYALVAGFYVRFAWENIPAPDTPHSIWLTATLYAVLVSISMVAVGLYQRGLPFSAGVLVRLGLSFTFAGMAMSVLFYSFPDLFLGRGVMAFAVLFSFGGLLATRGLFFRVVGADARLHKILVLGTGKNAKLISQLDGGPQGFTVVGYVLLSADDDCEIDDERCLKKDRELIDLVQEHDADEIVVAPDDRRMKLPINELLDCKMSGIKVLDLQTFFEKETSRIKLDILYPSWIVFSGGFQRGGLGESGKRLFDILAGLIILALGFPLMVLVALAIALESKGRGSVFFHQTRVGLNGDLFRVHKFRSMRMDAESDGVARWASKNDSRITRVGAIIRKTRLDELPQVFNVLSGEMSLVGPRPERPEFVEELRKEIPFYDERHRVKPGLTGWAQLCYQYGASIDDARNKLEFDLYYVKNSSFFLDLIVLLETVEVVLWGKGAH